MDGSESRSHQRRGEKVTTLVQFTLEQEEPVIFCLERGPELKQLPAGAEVWVDCSELPTPEAFGVELDGMLIWLMRAGGSEQWETKIDE